MFGARCVKVKMAYFFPANIDAFVRQLAPHVSVRSGNTSLNHIRSMGMVAGSVARYNHATAEWALGVIRIHVKIINPSINQSSCDACGGGGCLHTFSAFIARIKFSNCSYQLSI